MVTRYSRTCRQQSSVLDMKSLGKVGKGVQENLLPPFLDVRDRGAGQRDKRSECLLGQQPRLLALLTRRPTSR